MHRLCRLCLQHVHEVYADTHATYVGAGLYHIQGLSGGPVNNNSIIRSENSGSFGTLLCLSGSRVANVGSWITPHGQDITLSTTDIFAVTVGENDNPGYLNVSLEAGQSLGISQQGVYTCTIPDEREVQHTFHVGIYPSTFSSKFFKMLYECMIATQSKLM